MDKIDDKAPYFEHDNNVTPDDSPIGYPDMSGRDPMRYVMGYPPKRVFVYPSNKKK